MKNVFIPTSRVLAFREALEVVRDTVKGQPGFMVSWGEAGRGKTEAAKEYAVNHEDVVYLRVHEGWTPMAMLSAILKKLSTLEKSRVALVKQAVIEELDLSPRTLLIDEADRLDIRLIEHLRDIHDETGCPIVLIGEPSIYAHLKARGRIWQRVTRVVDFGPVVVDDVLLYGIKACDLKIEALAARAILKKCQGSFRLLYHIMVELERIAKANKTNQIPLAIVDDMPDRRPAPAPGRIR